jgi:hypothetical protein
MKLLAAGASYNMGSEKDSCLCLGESPSAHCPEGLVGVFDQANS